MPKLLEKALEKRWELQRPFVFFSHPNERFVHHYWQDDLQLQKTPIQEVNGFVLAPFELQNEHPFISDAQQRQYNRPEVKNIPDNLALPKETHDKESFLALIDKTRKQIEKGTFQKVVLSRPIHLPDASGHPVAMFLAMLSYFPKAMVYLWHHPQVGTWLGASPEQFLKIEGDQLYTMALAGTLPATSAPQWSSKEIEEQELVVEDIVQILQKQFPKKAITLSPPYNRTAGNLVHLCTDITVVASEFSLNQLTKALHPTPAVGGVPSERQNAIFWITRAILVDFIAVFLAQSASTVPTCMSTYAACSGQQQTQPFLLVVVSHAKVNQKWNGKKPNAKLRYSIICL